MEVQEITGTGEILFLILVQFDVAQRKAHWSNVPPKLVVYHHLFESLQKHRGGGGAFPNLLA